jgi:c-di-GMP-binding flagellar brake protein YcgR
MPILYGQLVKLPLNEKYNMLFYTEKGKLLFKAEITGYKKEQQFIYMTARTLNQGERTQLRHFYRFSCLLPVKFAKISEDLNEANMGKEEQLDGIIKDLGAGGMQFVSNNDIIVNSKIKCIIMLGEDMIIAIGMVRRKNYFPKSNYKYQFSVQFLSIMASEQEKIIKFVFAEQRRELLRAKG